MTPLIGREEEIELLSAAGSRLKTGEGRVVLLAGEAGIGKSRLIAALKTGQRRSARQRALFLPAASSGQRATADRYAIAARRALCGERYSGGKAQKARRTGGAGGRKGDDVADLFAELLGLAQGPPPTGTAEPQRRRRRLLEALLERLENAGAPRASAGAVRRRPLGRSDLYRAFDADVERLKRCLCFSSSHSGRTISRPGRGIRM